MLRLAMSPKARARIYEKGRHNTFFASKRVTVIPIIKDEGAAVTAIFLMGYNFADEFAGCLCNFGYYDMEKHRSRADKSESRI